MDFVTPAQVIEWRMRERGWSQRSLAMVLGVSEKTVSSFMNGRTKISNELALQLQAALSIDPEKLLRIQASYELKKAQLSFRPDPALATRATVFGDFPVSEMIARGWLRGVTDLWDTRLDAALCDFFAAKSISEIEVLPHAAKKADAEGVATPAQLACLYRVRQIADDILVPQYSENALRQALGKLSKLLISAQSAQKASRALAECGVRFAIVEALPATKIDGVCFWLDDSSPVIALSLRFDRIDNFWFVLRHEIEHVLQGHGKGSAMLDIDMDAKPSGEQVQQQEEIIANSAAAEFCVPQIALDKFVVRKAPFFAERDILGFAKTIGVHPGLVAGQLQRKINRYDLFRSHLVKIRSIVSVGTTVDGWGDVVPVGA